MSTTANIEFLARVKQAEMELCEAAFKIADGEIGTACACLRKAAEAITAAMEAAHG